MADYNPNTVSAYQQYASSMTSSGGGRNASGLGARSSSSNMTSAPSGSVDFTTIDTKTGKQTPVATIDYGNDDNDYVSPTVIYTAAAEASTQAGSVMAPQGPMANSLNLYSMPNMVETATDYVYRADRDDAITSAITNVQAEEQAQINAAISSINSAITMGKTDAEIAEAFMNDMGGFGNDKPDPLGGMGVPSVTLKDVTGTDEGALSNPQPLYDFAEEMANPSITKSELPSMSSDEQAALGAAIRKAAEEGTLSSKLSNIQFVRSDGGDRTDPSWWDNLLFDEPDGITEEEEVVDVSPAQEAPDQQGLMARPAPAASPVTGIVSEFVDEMESLEGLGGDDLLGDRMPTYAYGITKKKADEFGMKPSDYDTMREFAEAFSERYMEEKEAKYTDVFEGKTNKEKIALHSYLYNAGKFYPAQLRALNNNDMAGFVHEMRDVIKSEGKAVTGLSKRRAAEANIIGEESIEGWKPIVEVQVRGTRQKPIFDWVAEDGTVVETYESNKPLHSGSSMNTVSVN